MRFSVLSSGSKANSTYIEACGSRILIDCGLSAREAERRLRRLGVDPASLNAILITHEHGDHVYGVSALSRRYKIPVYCNPSTARHLKKVYALERFWTGSAFAVGTVEISPFSIVHDAADPVGFCFMAEGLKFVQATDLGRVTPLVRDFIFGAHAIVLESNHDQEMLRNCDYPWVLKQRISSAHGHLSNDCAGALLQEAWHGDLLHVVLAHISENSNRPDLALETVGKYMGEKTCATFLAAGPYSETPLYEIGGPVVRAA